MLINHSKGPSEHNHTGLVSHWHILVQRNEVTIYFGNFVWLRTPLSDSAQHSQLF